MADNNFFSHYSQNGTDPFQRMVIAGYALQGGAENVALGCKYTIELFFFFSFSLLFSMI